MGGAIAFEPGRQDRLAVMTGLGKEASGALATCG